MVQSKSIRNPQYNPLNFANHLILSTITLNQPIHSIASPLKRLSHVLIFSYIISPIKFTNPSARAEYDTRSIFKQSLTGLNSEFSFTKAEEPSLPYYLLIGGWRIIGFIPFARVLVLCEMLSVLSQEMDTATRWTRVALSISCDDNHYTTGTYLSLEVSIQLFFLLIFFLVFTVLV